MTQRRHQRRGFTLIEVMVAIGIVAMLGVLIYGAFHGMSRSKRNIANVSDRYQQGRAAVDRMAREMGAAFISMHGAENARLNSSLNTRQTAFIGVSSRVDFTAFANQPLRRDGRESDQAEIGYFTSNDPETGNLDLVRRLDKFIDDEPGRGGVVQVLAENIVSVEILYLDPLTNEWQESWDTTSPTGQLNRLPAQVWIILVMGGGPGDRPITFQTKAPVAIPLSLNFASGSTVAPTN